MALISSKAAWKALGVGSGQGSLKKLRIFHETAADAQGNVTEQDHFDALFNPNELSFSRRVVWKTRDAAGNGQQVAPTDLDFIRSAPERLQLTLFFDTYEPATSGDAVRNFLLPSNPFGGTGGPTASDVRIHTERVAELGRVHESLHRPPRCMLMWGGVRLFHGVLSRLDQKLTMFLPDGTPVRATLDCTFKEFDTAINVVRRRELHSSDVAKTVVFQATDSLAAIAAAEYSDPAQWRLIARANGIANPRTVAPGTVLILPPLPS